MLRLRRRSTRDGGREIGALTAIGVEGERSGNEDDGAEAIGRFEVYVHHASIFVREFDLIDRGECLEPIIIGAISPKILF